MTLGEFCYFTLLLFFVIQGCGGVRSNIDYRIGGEDPQALVCRPEGRGPFPAVVHNHGVGVDDERYQKAVKGGYDLPAICPELTANGFLTFVPISQVVHLHRTKRKSYGDRLCKESARRRLVSGCDYGELTWRPIDTHGGSRAKGLKALVIMAPASVGRNLYMTLSRVSSLDAAALGRGRRSTRDSE